jgi:hypothetical protein
MNTNRPTAAFLQKLVVAGVACVAIAFTAHAQVQSNTSTASAGAATKSVQVERGTVVYVSGNSVVVKASDGSLRHFDNVPDSVTVNVGGKQLNVHQLQVGMTVERQTITTKTPKMVTTVKTVTGTVKKLNLPKVTLTLADGTEQEFTIPAGTHFNINGKDQVAKDLRKGMEISAQQVTEVPDTVVTEQVLRSGTLPPPPPPAPDVPVLIVFAPAPAPMVAEAAPVALPKTASEMPLVGLIGALFLALGLAIRMVRTYREALK